MKFTLLFSLFSVLLFGCSAPDSGQADKAESVKVYLSLGMPKTKAFQAIDSLPLSVNRILVIPFQKQDENQPNSNTSNFIPAWNLVRQYDIDTFPANNIQLSLIRSFTYKVLIIGYNQNDYDYNNPNAADSRFDIRLQPIPTTLANFQLSTNTATDVAEFFTCFCTAVQANIDQGDIFVPDSDITLSGNLQRMVSGLDVLLTNVPAYVSSVSLTGGSLVKQLRLSDTTATQIQTSGVGDSLLIGQTTPQNGIIRLNAFLFPTQTTNKTSFYLNVFYDTRQTTYLIQVADGPVSVSNQIILKANEVVKIQGNFTQTGISFELNYSINLDDNQWDGYTN